MKAITYILVFIATIYHSFAQVNIPVSSSVNIMQPVETKVNFWVANYENLIVTLQNTSDTGFEFYLRFHLHGRTHSGELVRMEMSPDYFPNQSLGYVAPFQTLQVSAIEIESAYSNLGLSDFETTENIPLNIDGELPSGEYLICIEVMLYTESGLEPVFLSPRVCSDFFDIGHNSLTLITPFDGEVLPVFNNEEEGSMLESSEVLFAWQHNNLENADDEDLSPTYKLNIYDIGTFDEQSESLEEVLSTASPVFSKPNISELQYMYNSDEEGITHVVGRRYAAQVELEGAPSNTEYHDNRKSNIVIFMFASDTDDTVEETDHPLGDSRDDDVSCEDRCDPEVLSTTSINATNYSGTRIYPGYFTVELTDPLDNAGNGDGFLELPFLNNQKIRVSCEGVQLNSEGQVIGGKIVSLQESDTQLEDIYQMFHSNQDDASIIAQDIATAAGQLLDNARHIAQLFNDNPVKLPLSFHQSVGYSDFMISLIDFTFEDNQAKTNLLVGSHYFAQGEPKWLLFKGKDICLHPYGFTRDLTVETEGDLEFGNNMVIKRGSNVKLGCSGIEKVQLNGEFQFPRKFKTISDNKYGTDRVIGEFSVIINNENTDEGEAQDQSPDFFQEQEERKGIQFITEVTVPDTFYHESLPKWKIMGENLLMDFSTHDNVENFRLPEGYTYMEYTGGENETPPNEWTGLRAQNFRLFLPRAFENNTNAGVTSLALNDVIIDDTGLSVFASTEIDNIETGVNGWGVNIDSIFVNIMQGDFESFGFGGQMDVPVFSDDSELRYQASYSGDNEFVSEVYVPGDEKVAAPFAMGEFILYPNSRVGMRLSEEENSDDLDIDLFAEVYAEYKVKSSMAKDHKSDACQSCETFANVNVSIPGMSIEFEYDSDEGFTRPIITGIGVPEYQSLNTAHNFEQGSSTETASKSRSASGFLLSMDELEFGIVDGGVNVDFGFGLDMGGSKGGSDEANRSINFDMTFACEIYKNNRNRNKFRINRLDRLCGQISWPFGDAMHIEGWACGGSIPNTGGQNARGFVAELNIDLPIGVGGRLSGAFGTVKNNDNVTDDQFGTSDYYSFWFLDGSFYSDTGIPMGVTTLHALGGGFYYNMHSPTNSQDLAQVAGVSDPSEEVGPSNVGEEFRTEKGFDIGYNQYGINMQLGLGFMAKQLFVDGQLTVNFSKNATTSALSINDITLRGEAHVFNKLYSKRKDEKYRDIWAAASLEYTITNTEIEFNFKASAKLRLGKRMGLEGDGDISAYYRSYRHSSRNPEWRFMIGNMVNDKGHWRPRKGNHLFELNLKLSEKMIAKTETYFVGGNHAIPSGLPEYPSVIKEFFNKREDNGFSSVGLEPEQDESGIESGASGLIVGAHAKLTADVNAFLYASLAVHLGFDVSFLQQDREGCHTTGGGYISKVGTGDGLYAEGRAFAMLHGSIGVNFNLKFIKKIVEIASIKAGLLLEGGLPNPSYFSGRGRVVAAIFGGKVRINAGMKIDFGERCIEENTSPFDFPIVDNTYPKEGDKIKYNEVPIIEFNIGKNEVFNIIEKPNRQNSRQNKQLKLIVDNIRIRNTEDATYDLQEEIDWSFDNRTLQFLHPEKLWGHAPGSRRDMPLKISFRMRVKSRLYKDRNDESKWKWEDYVENYTLNFKVKPLPNDIQPDMIEFAHPGLDAGYFLPDEYGTSPNTKQFVKMKEGNTMDQYFGERDKYNYYVEYYDDASGSPNEEILIPSANFRRKKIFIPQPAQGLDSKTTYLMQIIRKSNIGVPMGKNYNTVTTNLEDRTGLEGQLAVDKKVIRPTLQQMNHGRTVRYKCNFRTSKYGTLAEKLHASRDFNTIGNNSNNVPMHTKKEGDLITHCIDTDEDFDIYGFQRIKAHHDISNQERNELPSTLFMSRYEALTSETRLFLNSNRVNIIGNASTYAISPNLSGPGNSRLPVVLPQNNRQGLLSSYSHLYTETEQESDSGIPVGGSIFWIPGLSGQTLGAFNLNFETSLPTYCTGSGKPSFKDFMYSNELIRINQVYEWIEEVEARHGVKISQLNLPHREPRWQEFLEIYERYDANRPQAPRNAQASRNNILGSEYNNSRPYLGITPWFREKTVTFRNKIGIHQGSVANKTIRL